MEIKVEVKTDNDIDFVNRIHVIMHRLQLEYDVSQFPKCEIEAAKILLKDIK